MPCMRDGIVVNVVVKKKTLLSFQVKKFEEFGFKKVFIAPKISFQNIFAVIVFDEAVVQNVNSERCRR